MEENPYESPRNIEEPVLVSPEDALKVSVLIMVVALIAGGISLVAILASAGRI